MKKTKILITLIFAFLYVSISFSNAQAIKVEVIQTEGKWILLRDGEPYYIKGAGGNEHLEELVKAGGNSIRIWSENDAQQILDNAHKNGLTVMFGLWMPQERQGFDYGDEAAVKKQYDHFKEVVTKFKDHPALLMWAVGNEVDLFYTNFKVWDAVEDIARMIHETDPNHPVTTVTAGLHEKEVRLIKEKVPSLDIFSVNTYSEVCKIQDQIRLFGWTGPYIIAEWGPDGHWEVNKTEWLAPIEQTGHEKALCYANRYRDCIIADSNYCIGSYVFLWGQKQETTATWYGMFTEEGNPTEVIDYISKAWNGKWPLYRSPTLDSMTLNKQNEHDNIRLKSGQVYKAKVYVTSNDNENLIYRWKLLKESTTQGAGGDAEAAPDELNGLFKGRNGKHVRFIAPPTEGAYRLFVYVIGKGDKTTYANIPFYVSEEGLD
jgi:hypothetical protein